MDHPHAEKPQPKRGMNHEVTQDTKIETQRQKEMDFFPGGSNAGKKASRLAA